MDNNFELTEMYVRLHLKQAEDFLKGVAVSADAPESLIRIQGGKVEAFYFVLDAISRMKSGKFKDIKSELGLDNSDDE